MKDMLSEYVKIFYLFDIHHYPSPPLDYIYSSGIVSAGLEAFVGVGAPLFSLLLPTFYFKD